MEKDTAQKCFLPASQRITDIGTYAILPLLQKNRRGTEVAITGPTRNRVGGYTPTWVRIPPSPPFITSEALPQTFDV